MTGRNTVIYPVRRHFVERPVEKIHTKSHFRPPSCAYRRASAECEKRVEAFFAGNVLNPFLIQRGLREIAYGDLSLFDSPIVLPKLRPIDAQEHEQRWKELSACILDGDMVTVLDQSSTVSRLISRIDVGTWSHTAVYLGDGYLTEAITSGVIERSINVYGKQRYRLGIYRIPGLPHENLRKMREFACLQLGKPYNWRGAAFVAWKKILGLNPTLSRRFDLSPNDLIALSHLRLVHVV